MTELISPPAADVRPRRFTSDEVQAMLRAGILHEDDRLELIDGQLIAMSPIGDPHIACINRLNHIFSKHLFTQEIENVRVSIQNPVRIDPHNEPEPDVVLTTALDGAPQPEDVLLLIEVADSSLSYDRTVKLPLYAQAGLSEMWIVNLADAQIEVHREPDGNVYRTRRLASSEDTLSVERLPDLTEIPAAPILSTGE